MFNRLQQLKMGTKLAIGNGTIVIAALLLILVFFQKQIEHTFTALNTSFSQNKQADECQLLLKLGLAMRHILMDAYQRHASESLEISEVISPFNQAVKDLNLTDLAHIALCTLDGDLLYDSSSLKNPLIDQQKGGLINGVTHKIKEIYPSIAKKATDKGRADLLYRQQSNEKGTPFLICSYLLQPLPYLLILEFELTKEKWQSELSEKALIPQRWIGLWGSIFTFMLIIVFFNVRFTYHLLKPLHEVRETMAQLDQRKVNPQRSFAQTKDEIGSMRTFFNSFMINLNEIIQKTRETTGFLSNIGQSVTVSTKNISDISQQQAEGVKEVVGVMESANTTARHISVKVKEVSKIAVQTKSEVESGCGIIRSTAERNRQLQQEGKDSIQNVRLLNEKMDHVSDIVKTIEGIASQTKMIAFNAELEATAAGGAGKNFKIVAMETRRLSDSIMEATSKIKLKIAEAQSLIDHIVVSSEESAYRIREGLEQSNQLQIVFGTILTSAEVSATSSQQISLSIQNQTEMFGQILNTLKQLSDNIEQFTELTIVTSYTSEAIDEVTAEFSQLLKRYH